MNHVCFCGIALGIVSFSPLAPAQVDWTTLAATGAPGWGCASAWDEPRGLLVAFGGIVNGLPTAVTAESDGSAWTTVSPTMAPSARTFAAMAFDAARGCCTLFGGAVHPVIADGETWTWDGAAWTLRSPTTSPSPRMNAAIAYDGARQVVVLFGGWLTPTFVATNETWEWNGVTWTLRTSLGATPPPRKDASMAFDAARGLVVMCGGYDPLTQNSRHDTWTWDGSTWTQMADLPTPTSDHSLTFDTARERVVLAGGMEIVAGFATAYLDQVLDWDGVSWTPRPTAALAAARAYAASGYDTSGYRVLIAGGTSATSTLTDTVALAPIAAGEFASFGAGCPSSAGPLSLTSPNLPYVGTTFVQRITGAPASANECFVVFGVSNTTRGGGPLPIGMAPFGAPGCQLLVGDDGFLSIPLANGQGTHAWAVPSQPALVGQRFFTQAFVVDSALAMPLPIAMSAGRAALIGSP